MNAFVTEPPEPPVILAVAGEEMRVHAVVDRQRKRLLACLELLRRQHERGVEDEALVVGEERDDVVVAGDEPDRRLAVEAGLEMDRIVLAHARVGLVCGRPERRAVEVVPRGLHHPAAMMSRL